MTAEEATEDILAKQLPEVARLRAEGQLSVENIDVFCEKGVFNVDQVRFEVPLMNLFSFSFSLFSNFAYSLFILIF